MPLLSFCLGKQRFRSYALMLYLMVVTSSIIAQQNSIDPINISIARDTWGVPHIFAPTDAEVAYGLAWANAEDAFETMQELLIIGKQMMGRKEGVTGAPFDFFVHSLNVQKTYDEQIEQISEEYIRYLEGYCQGINAYAKQHPDQVLIKKAFPIVPEDILKAYTVGFSALSGSVEKVTQIMEGGYDKSIPSKPAGSNAYAMAPSKTQSGHTFLAINPHFQINGPFSFYEAHLQSQQGLNITGALFQGGSCVFMGNNEHLGWGKTFNHIDQVDVFRLQMHPHKKLFYRLDSAYVKLEKRPVWLKVRLGKIVIPVRKMTYWSVYGPTYRSPDKQFFSVRCPAFFNLRAGEQYYRMNKADDFDAFKKALSMNAHSMFNLVYADKDGHILYLCNGMLPKRATDFDYSGILDGNTRANLWTEYYTQDALPRVEDPDCGYVFNTNNTPTNASCLVANNCSEEVLEYADTRYGDNNRSHRFMEMMQGRDKWDFEAFKALKFDTKMTKNSAFWGSLSTLFEMDAQDYPQVEEALLLLQKWDGDAGVENTTAALFMLSLQYIFDTMGYDDRPFTTGIPDQLPASLWIKAIEKASGTLLQQHGAIKVPLGQILFHKRNGKLHPASGFPDALSPIYTKADAAGRQIADYADTYIHFVEFDQKGPLRIETLLPFEVTKSSETYKDELKMFNKRQLKRMSLNKFEVLQKAVKLYHPQ